MWLQAARDVADQVHVRLELVDVVEPTGPVRQPVLRLTPTGQVKGRVDARFSLGAHAHRVEGSWVSVRAHGRSGRKAHVRVNLHDHAGRRGLGDFVVGSDGWSTLLVQVPLHTCQHALGDGDLDQIWLELVLDAGHALDVTAPVLVEADPTDPFESLHVQAQADVLLAVRDRPAASGEAFSVVIPFFGKAAYTAACALSVLQESWASPEIVLIDDGSPHSTTVDRILASLPGPVRIVRAGFNRGYTAGVNAGVRAASHDRVVILNNDTRVTPGWDAPLLEALTDPTVFACGPLSNAASYQSVPHLKQGDAWAVNDLPPGVTPLRLGEALRNAFSGRLLTLPILNGFCYAVRRSQFLELGGLDEQAFPHGYGEEVDLMLRARDAGLRSLVTPDSFVYHYKSITFAGQRAELSKAGNLIVQQRWGAALQDAVHEMDEDPEFARVRLEVSALFEALSRGI